MRILQMIKCRLRWHRWGQVAGDDWGAHQECADCGHSRRLGIDKPPDAHDQLGITH